ncbi:MAG: D-alanine--D-alanine ligase [Bifidobacteriaceae bacterium]|jgi:D-alanine-D-alanine ligase|nr:D-alanine--D-alanine ligase [Bifidobacteriaceae bacterium]
MQEKNDKKTIGLIYGGKSPEHKISILSAKNIYAGLLDAGFEVICFYIDMNGKWYIGAPEENDKRPLFDNNLIENLKVCESVFIAVHGKTGEDGVIGGFLETFGIKYIGCSVESSALCFDKHRTKLALQARGIPVARYVHIDVRDGFSFIEEFLNTKLAKSFFPCFVKPCRSGSSYGVKRVQNFQAIMPAIKEAAEYDHSVLIEEEIIAREIECAVLEGERISEPKVSLPAEIRILDSGNSFYTTAAKYENDSVPLQAPANLTDDQLRIIQNTAATAFAALECQSLARVDMFLTDENMVLVNEINTIPGFTPISQFPKMWDVSGLDLPNLLKALVDTAHL